MKKVSLIMLALIVLCTMAAFTPNMIKHMSGKAQIYAEIDPGPGFVGPKHPVSPHYPPVRPPFPPIKHVFSTNS